MTLMQELEELNQNCSNAPGELWVMEKVFALIRAFADKLEGEEMISTMIDAAQKKAEEWRNERDIVHDNPPMHEGEIRVMMKAALAVVRELIINQPKGDIK